jgi:hypothetical protein
MSCQSCGYENPAANRLCGSCGAALARTCPACDHANPATHRFCGSCGTSLVTEPVRVRDDAEARLGTLAAGGELESVFARLLLYRDGRLGAVEQFELEHLDVARARFEELRAETAA